MVKTYLIFVMSILKPTSEEVTRALELREKQTPSPEVIQQIERVREAVDKEFGPDGKPKKK